MNNPGAGDVVLTCQSLGEFLLFGNSNNVTAQIKLSADQPAAAGTSEPISSVQIQFNGVQYPSVPLSVTKTVNGGVALDATQLYQEYLKAIARVGRRDVTPAIPYDVFKTTMPFIYFRPFADDGVKLSNEGHTLIIRMNGGSTHQNLQSQNLSIVVFEYKTFIIRPDGSCSLA